MRIQVFLSILLSAIVSQCSGALNTTFLVDRKLSSGRRRHSTRRSPKNQIWGRCRWWRHNKDGCELKDPSQCSDHLSAGPSNADVEIRIGNLPPSTADKDVHLQWWSAQKSELEYKPLENPLQSQVHWRQADAYPKYYDDDFNGGNVRVNANGEATIRVQAPSAYRMFQWISYPHIHLRICSGIRFLQRQETLYFTETGLHFNAGCRRQSIFTILSNISISSNSTPTNPMPTSTSASSTTYAATTQTTAATSGAAATVASTTTYAATTVTTRISATTTTTAQEIDANDTIVREIDTSSEPAQATPMVGLIRSAMKALDLGALEFSPIYECFLDNKFFDHFTSDCASSCPDGKDIRHGQCVQPKTAGAARVNVQATWRFSVQCGEQCLSEKPKITLHHIRLAVADYLDIPFQEVRQVKLKLGRSTSNGRRLTQVQPEKIMSLTIQVASSRITAAQGQDFKSSFINETAFASTLLDLKVTAINPSISTNNPEPDTPLAEVTDTNDPYSPAYLDVEPKVQPSAFPGSPTDGLPTLAIIGIAAGILVVGLGTGAFLVIRRRRTQAPEIVAKGKEIEGNKIGVDDS